MTLLLGQEWRTMRRPTLEVLQARPSGAIAKLRDMH
jgi:hypothetical protein